VKHAITPEPYADCNDWTQAGATAADLQRALDRAQIVKPPPPIDAIQAAIADARPKIRLPGDDRLGNDFAAELGEDLRGCDIFLRNGEVCILRENQLHPVDPQAFRTWVESHVICYRKRNFKGTSYEIDVTMRDDEARCVLASPQFASTLRVVRRVNHARLPIIRNDGTIELLLNGYDLNSQTLTAGNVTYPEDMPLMKAVETLNDLLGEFVFADGERSKAVAIAAMVGLYAAQLLLDKSLRPCFIFMANAEGAGKSLLADCCIVPACGEPPTSCKSKEDDEIRKLLLTAVREARTIIKFDNLKGHLSSEALEAFLSSTTVSDRKLGVNEYITGDNLANVFINGNDLTVSPDQRRRSLFVELHQPAERPEHREFKRPLDVPILLTMRPNLLAALWAFLRHWDVQGRPPSTRSHSAFPSWAKIVGVSWRQPDSAVRSPRPILRRLPIKMATICGHWLGQWPTMRRNSRLPT
jgi:hypothetical protein